MYIWKKIKNYTFRQSNDFNIKKKKKKERKLAVILNNTNWTIENLLNLITKAEK